MMTIDLAGVNANNRLVEVADVSHGAARDGVKVFAWVDAVLGAALVGERRGGRAVVVGV